jgi:hypothetical protein
MSKRANIEQLLKKSPFQYLIEEIENLPNELQTTIWEYVLRIPPVDGGFTAFEWIDSMAEQSETNKKYTRIHYLLRNSEVVWQNWTMRDFSRYHLQGKLPAWIMPVETPQFCKWRRLYQILHMGTRMCSKLICDYVETDQTSFHIMAPQSCTSVYSFYPIRSTESDRFVSGIYDIFRTTLPTDEDNKQVHQNYYYQDRESIYKIVKPFATLTWQRACNVPFLFAWLINSKYEGLLARSVRQFINRHGAIFAAPPYRMQIIQDSDNVINDFLLPFMYWSITQVIRFLKLNAENYTDTDVHTLLEDVCNTTMQEEMQVLTGEDDPMDTPELREQASDLLLETADGMVGPLYRLVEIPYYKLRPHEDYLGDLIK